MILRSAIVGRIATLLFALHLQTGCAERDQGSADQQELWFTGPVQPGDFQAPPTISIKADGPSVETELGYEKLVRCSAGFTILRNTAANTNLTAPQRESLRQIASLLSRRLQLSAEAERKTSTQLSADLVQAQSAAAQQPDEFMGEALKCVGRLAPDA